jgi:hypothetical protein
MADKWQKYGLDISGITSVVDPIISTLDKGISALNAAFTALSSVAKILQLYINAFSSFSSLIATFVQFTKNAVNNFAKDFSNTGVYCNVFVPPAYSPDQISNLKYTKLASGGFTEFHQSLKVSLNSTSDVNTPQFSEQATVGGFIIMVDAETPDAFFRGVEFLTSNLNLSDLVPINTKTLPPQGIKTSTGYFTASDGTQKLGVKLEWDPPPVKNFTHYRISRALAPGGDVIETTYPVPTKLFGPKGHAEEGLFVAVMKRLWHWDWAAKWPPVTKASYKDPDFNGGKPKELIVNPLTGKGSYIDFEVNTKETIKYYYVIQSGFSLINKWSSYSVEAGVPLFPKNCVSSNMAGAAMHQGGHIHLISAGEKLGQWSALRVGEIVPFVPAIVILINGLLKKLEGGLKTNSKSFVEFLNGIQQKFKQYKAYIQTISDMIVALENIFTGLPEIGILNLAPQAGGTDNFIKRVENATRPPEGFTGPEGITMGIVFVYGSYRISIDALGNQVPDMQAQVDALSKTFTAIEKLLT